MPYVPWLVDEKYRCPNCGSRLEYEPDCAGYPSRNPQTGRETVMVCVPGCGGAYYLQCSNQACNYWYREPNRRSNTFYVHGDHAVLIGMRPVWFDEWVKAHAPFDEDEDEDDED